MKGKEIVLHALLTQREELTTKLFEPVGIQAVPDGLELEVSDSNAFDKYVREERDLLDDFIIKVMASPEVGDSP